MCYALRYNQTLVSAPPDDSVCEGMRKIMMYKALSPGAIKVQPRDLDEALAAARTGGFQGVEIKVHEIADLVDRQGAGYVRERFAVAGLQPAGWGLPVDWKGSEEAWQAGLLELPRLAAAAAAIGCTRTTTWIPPTSDSRPFEENYQFHLARFRPIARILAEHGCRLGLEFIGPKTSRDAARHIFIYRMEDMLHMGEEIGPNVGLLLDCWHWYTSGGTLEDLRALHDEQVVYVHVNDAPAGIARDEQRDNVRALPGETGVIEIAGFLQALQAIGYDGPVVPEPFKRELADLPSDADRLRVVGAAMDRIFEQAGLSSRAE
jgi:sugar phosphate isomerase/epimerase